MDEVIVYNWRLNADILTKLTSSYPLLATNSPFFGPEHNPKMFMLRLNYNSLSLELGNFHTPVKIKSFAAKIYSENVSYNYTSTSGLEKKKVVATFPGSVRQVFPGISGLCKKEPQRLEELKHDGVKLREFVDNSKFINICCNVILYHDTSQDKVKMIAMVKKEVPSAFPSFLLDLRKLREESKLTDVILCLSDGKEIPTHKAILGSRSSVFEAMFSHGKMLENQDNRVKIDDISSEIMEIILNFVYGEEMKVKMDDARDVITAADKYDLQPLIKLCIETMVEHLKAENAAEIFYLADLHSLNVLKDIVMSFINNNSIDVMNSEGWTKFISKNAHLVVQLYAISKV